MRILVDITHPAHVHFFRNAINIWRQHGHEVNITARDKDITLPLLDDYGYKYTCLSKARQGIVGLGLELFEHQRKLLQIIKNFKPDILLEIAGTFIVHVGKLTNTPALVFYDTEHARLSNTITYPFADVICTPSCYKADLGTKHIRYEGYQELAYLHPNYFSQNLDIVREIDLKLDQPLFLVRFVSWKASHDIGDTGFSYKGKVELVERLSTLGRVIITSEAQLPQDLKLYQIQVSPTKIHQLLAFSTLYIGESATMASEAAILGTPFILVSPVGRSYTDEQERKYGLGYTINPKDEKQAIELAVKLTQRKNLQQEWQAKQSRLLKDKIDVTVWLVELVEKYSN